MKYKNGKGVEDINISVDDGEVKALLGPNGSGKSTTMRSFMGFLNSSEGSLKVAGVDTIANPVEDWCRFCWRWCAFNWKCCRRSNV